MAGTTSPSLVHQYASMQPGEFSNSIEPKWQVGGQLVAQVRTAAERNS
jgi:hypothetical protein